MTEEEKEFQRWHKLGLLMLAIASQRPQPNIYEMTDEQLRQEIAYRRAEVNMLAEFVRDCRADLAEAQREHHYQQELLDWCEGHMEVREFNRRDANESKRMA